MQVNGPDVKLTGIPPHLQAIYNVGPEVEARRSYDAMGGSLTFVNNDGGECTVDAVELSSTGIKIQVIQPSL